MRTQEKVSSFAMGFGSLSSKIIREYANGMADGFLNDLVAGHIPGEAPTSENALIEAFILYVARASNHSSE
jgi:hypothetical protein